MPTIAVSLPADRTKLGSLQLLADDGTTLIAGPFSAFGKADGQTANLHGNASRNTLLPFGDTPAGTYAVPGLEATGGATTRSSHSYGPNGAIRLNPTGGDADTAATLGGRQYLLIHGGDLNGSGQLRPTNGCIRLSNADMASLLNAISVEAKLTAPPNACAVDELSVLVIAGGVDDGYDEGDPPPPANPIPFPVVP
jgi:hypothetical protein